MCRDRELDAFVSFRLDEKNAGSVIGPKGSIVSEIRNASSTSIALSQEVDVFNCRQVRVIGKLPNVVKAMEKLLGIVQPKSE